MAKNSFLVLVCEDYVGHSDTKTRVLELPQAVERLDKKGLALKVTERRWQIKERRESGRELTLSRKKVGEYEEFRIGGLQNDITYLIGVYDRRATGQMQNMVDAILHKECERHDDIYSED